MAYKGHHNSRSKRLDQVTYEINLAKKLQESEDKKKKNIALKATTKEEEVLKKKNQVKKMVI